jgi:hypothetical protein
LIFIINYGIAIADIVKREFYDEANHRFDHEQTRTQEGITNNMRAGKRGEAVPYGMISLSIRTLLTWLSHTIMMK